MEKLNFEKRLAVLGTILALGLGATACGDNEIEPIRIPESAIELGPIGDIYGDNGDDIGFLFHKKDERDVKLVDCGPRVRAVEIQRTGDIIVACDDSYYRDVVVEK